MNTAKQPNRLIHETSPYLIQHAFNPVNWFPWGKEAFAKAKSENKPVFLSIGYSTCHWCHVMEGESFEDTEVADYLNAHFVSIKVDKEERPDIDSVYMNVCQALTGSGGWPLTIIMTPDQKPFFAGTYFPKNRNYGRPGLLDILGTVVEQWKTSSKQLYTAGEEIAASLSRANRPESLGQQPGEISIEAAARYFKQAFDSQYGGFGVSPKFPTPHNLMFLLRCHRLNKNTDALQMVEKTLQQMYRGGIFDHIGFGFSRYSTDEKWLVPHFEKMLYDNALLAIAYLETYQVTGNPLYKTVAEKTFRYIEREMTSPEGGFFSAQDADSEGEEGLFYTFTQGEVESVLGRSKGERLRNWFGITKSGNFEGKSILNLINNPDFADTNLDIEDMLPRLRDYRVQRALLHKDDKILTSWNAIMIVAYAKAYRFLGEGRYLDTAVRAFNFIKTNLKDNSGQLLISFRDGKAQGRGLLDDYAYMAWASLELYEATYDAVYLDECLSLSNQILSRFSDEKGGFFLNANNSESLIFRPMEQYDGAMPSGNSVFALCLAKLAALTGDGKWQQESNNQMAFYSAPFAQQPYAHCFALMGLMQATGPSRELVCVVNNREDETAVVTALTRSFFPNTTVIVKTNENAKLLERLAPFTQNYPLEGDRSAFYICENKSCSAPIYSLDEVLKLLD